MSARLGLLLGLIALIGCVGPEESRPSRAWQTFRVDADPGPEHVLLDIALIQQPFDDDYLRHELWTGADEMILPIEVRETLDLNGYRVGILVGSAHEKLTQLIQSERTCLEHKGRSSANGLTVTQNLRETKETVPCRIQTGKRTEAVTLDRPRFLLDLIPTLAADPVVRLKVAPRVETGDKAVNYKPLPNESKWELELKRSDRVLTGCTFAIDLQPNQILILGPRLDREGTVGFESFVHQAGEDTYQRLLVLKQVRPNQPRYDPIEYSGVSPPLAAQATMSP